MSDRRQSKVRARERPDDVPVSARGLSALAVREPITIAVAVILVAIAGLVAVRAIPIQLTPDVEDTVIAVTTRWQSASPDEIEQEVIDRQEERLQGLTNLRNMTSTSSQGSGVIRLEFMLGTDKDVALREVSDKLRQVPRYPDNVDEPVVDASDPDSRDYIAWIVLSSTDPAQDVRLLKDFAEDRIKPLLERVTGVAEVNVLGGREREVQVRFDANLLARRGVTLRQLSDALRATNLNVSGGEISDGKLDIRLRAVGQFSRVEDVQQTVIAQTAAGPVRVQDVAEVFETFRRVESFVRSKGRPVIAINAQKEVGANVMQVMDGIRGVIAEVNAPGGTLDMQARALDLDGKLLLEQVYDQTIYIDDALRLVRNNIFLGGSFAVLALLLFLRAARAVFIVGLAIPVSLIGAMVVMVTLGRSINVVSLAGMAFAAGMVVDNAIVVLENIFRHLEMGKRPIRAALDGAREVSGAVLASTLTTVAAFVPILLVQEEAGQLFRDIALALSAAIVLSLLVSITVVPAASSRWLRPFDDNRRPGPVERVLAIPGRFVAWIPNAVAKLVHWLCGTIVARLAVIGTLVTVSVVGTVFLMPPSDYLPSGNRNLIFGLLIPPPGYGIAQQNTLADRVEETFRPFFEAGSIEDPQRRAEAERALPSYPTFDPITRRPGPMVQPPSLDNYFFVSRAGSMFHGGISTDPQRVVDLQPLFAHSVRPEVTPGVLAFAFQVPLFRLGGTSGSAVKIDFIGDDLDRVSNSAFAGFMAIANAYGFGTVRPNPNNFMIPGPELRIVPNLRRLSEVGLTSADLALAVQTAGDGAIIGEYRLGNDLVDLVIVSDEALGDGGLDRVNDLAVATADGSVVPLWTLAEVTRTTAPQQINRVDRRRAVTLEFTAPSGLPLEQAVASLEGILAGLRADGQITPDVQVQYTGSASKLRSVRASLLGDGTVIGTLTSSLVLALIVVYLVMVVLFQSFVHPLVIMFSVPLATLGGFLGLAIVHAWSLNDRYLPVQNLDVLTMLGFIILIGTVVNNAILIVHQSRNFMRGVGEGDGDAVPPMAPRDAIAEAVRTRIRPIFMTTCTSMGAMLPLVLMPGSGSELYRGLGAVVIGGLVVSTVFTLLLVPLLFSLVVRAPAETELATAPGPGGTDSPSSRTSAPPPKPTPVSTNGVSAPTPGPTPGPTPPKPVKPPTTKPKSKPVEPTP